MGSESDRFLFVSVICVFVCVVSGSHRISNSLHVIINGVNLFFISTMIRNDAAKIDALVNGDIVIGARLNGRYLLMLQHDE